MPYVFCEGERILYEQLKIIGTVIGAAFQKVNFLRDMKADNKVYQGFIFPVVISIILLKKTRRQIEKDIHKDFQRPTKEYLKLPLKARFGVYVAYKYYLSLFKKIKKMKPAMSWNNGSAFLTTAS